MFKNTISLIIAVCTLVITASWIMEHAATGNFSLFGRRGVVKQVKPMDSPGDRVASAFQSENDSEGHHAAAVTARQSVRVNKLVPQVNPDSNKFAKKLSGAGLRSKAEKLLDIVCENPYQTSPPFEKLIGDLSGVYSRRINIQHRLVYQILDDEKVVKVIRMWSHYE